MALAERLINARLGDAIVDHFTYALAGDGCLMEGISQEAISLAGHLKLNKLIVLFDDNQISIDGPTSLAVSDDQVKRFQASGWAAQRIDGHDPQAIAGAIEWARRSDKPTLIACKTVIGYGAPTKQGKSSTHGEPLGADEIKGAREKLGWAHAPFEVPADVLAAWRAAGARGADAAQGLGAALRASSMRRRGRCSAIHSMPRLGRRSRVRWPRSRPSSRPRRRRSPPASPRRGCSRSSCPALPCLIGGSADLTGSNGTRTKQHVAVAANEYAGNYIHYGVREHAMAAAMNGLALHGGIVPYGATFLVFTDYCRPAIRLSALMGQRVIYVMTHDSIGLGEDGPTHQPVEHLAALRAIPNLNVFRPADGIETAECWELALASPRTPSILALTRQAVPALRKGGADNLSAKGAYVLEEAQGGKRDVTILATGSEVGLAMEARERLAKDGVQAAVVSMPCWELFAAQPVGYRQAVLGKAPRVAVEAAVGFGWERWLGEDGVFIGMEGFGASAPAPKLYEHFGITPAKVADAARKLLSP